MFTPEILLVDGDDELLDDAAADDKKLLEARMIAKRIKELHPHHIPHFQDCAS